MAEVRENMAAIAVAVGVNFVLLLLLLRVVGSVPAGSHSPRLSIRWIERPQKTRAPAATVTVATPAHVRFASSHNKAHTLVEIPTETPSAGEPITVAEDSWAMPMHHAPGISDDDALRQRLSKGRVADPLAQKSVLPGLRMQDRSLGGRLARMARASDCRELRAALHRQPASTETILKTMAERGCSI